MPLLPVVVPGDADSPGASSCSFTKFPDWTAMDGVVDARIVECVMLDDVTVALPPVFKARLKLLLPLTSAALAGKVAFASLHVMATVSLVLIKFQLASTALT